ncbi:hypothetical protein E2C01_040450 [Portunus trituberculatus]|uniref:Uncharacterized protein n=1 Tax=Portunus trituberculatus TaxID=210409 RepID=A0A5B7FQT0_PORTR|nr:hypothetical protein [Portunus trituberculatus]
MKRRARRSGEWCLLVRKGERSSGRLSEWKRKNSFAVLEGVEEEREKAGGDEVRRADDSLPAGKVLVVGDSQVRHLDSAFRAKDRKRRMREVLESRG